MQECGNAATVGAWCDVCWKIYTGLEALWAREQRWAPAHERRQRNIARHRKARRWRFVNVFLVMAFFEGLVAYALEVPWSWRFGALCLAWALGFAMLGALFGGGVEKGAK